MGGVLLGWRTVCAVELDPYCRRVLLARQRDGLLPRFPIWDDVRTFDGKPWRGNIDVISGGFPCQDISCAGKGAGITGERSGLWTEFARIIGEVGPRHVFVENSPMLTVRGLGVVLGDLATLGFDARWGVFSACSVGASHMRRRLFVMAHAGRAGLQGIHDAKRRKHLQPVAADIRRIRLPAPELARGRNAVAARVDRLRAIGNGQVPAVVRLAWEALTGD